MDWNDGIGSALTIKWKPLCLTTGFGESKYHWARCPPPLVNMIGAMAATRPPHGEWERCDEPPGLYRQARSLSESDE